MSPSTKLGVPVADSRPNDVKVKEDPIENSEKLAGKVMNVSSATDADITKVKDFKLPKGIYSGEMMNGKRHGYGIMKWDSGFVEESCWLDDFKHGLSMRKYPCGVVHWLCFTAAGDKKSSMPNSLAISKLSFQYYPMISARMISGGNGDCLVTLANGWTLKVGFDKNGNMEGKGMVENTEGKVMFEGEWKQNVLQFGSPLFFIFWAAWFVRYPLWYMIVVSSILFSMHSLLSGAHHRLSHMQVSNSTLFSDGQPGAQYSGQLSYFHRHGQGVMRYYDHSHFGNATLMCEYNGSWSQGVMSGRGSLTFSLDAPSQRGDVLYGEWVENRLTHGVCKYFSGEVYTGDLVNFERHGAGTMRYVDGSVYEGQFRRGNREGRGKLVEPGEFVCEGEWRNDKFSDAKECKRVNVMMENVVTTVTRKKSFINNVVIFFNRVEIPEFLVILCAVLVALLILCAICFVFSW